jgi:hypothetical protein
MDIKVWYSKGIKQWRWSLLDIETRRQESGQQYHIRDAMNDIATTIEYMVEKHEYEGQDL